GPVIALDKMRSLRKRLPSSGQPTAAVPAEPLEVIPPVSQCGGRSRFSATGRSARTLGIHLPKFPYGGRGRARCQPSRAAPVVDLEIPAPFWYQLRNPWLWLQSPQLRKIGRASCRERV